MRGDTGAHFMTRPFAVVEELLHGIESLRAVDDLRLILILYLPLTTGFDNRPTLRVITAAPEFSPGVRSGFRRPQEHPT